MTQAAMQYERIADAISYLQTHFKTQPSLEELAAKMHVSPFHFQRIFTDWAGISPKKFLQFISVEYAKSILVKSGATLFDAAYATGLSGTSRLHDLFVQIEGMTPGSYKQGGQDLHITYNFDQTPFGKVLVAATDKGICHMAFTASETSAVQQLNNRFPNAKIAEEQSVYQSQALAIFSKDWRQPETIKLHLKGTAFQLKVWQALLSIPLGQLKTYGYVAQQIGQPSAARAVGTAIGSNPVAFLIPCHRVIQATGAFGGYMWGEVRKTAIIGWEAAHCDKMAQD